MRIIAGARRGKKIRALEGEKVRPTTDRVKEALFNILQFRIEGRSFLDLFAGSGQVGLEALSRGAESAYFVDNSEQSVKVIEWNIRETGFGSLSEVFLGDYGKFYSRIGGKQFDIIFLDPPYRENLLIPALKMSELHVKPAGLIVCEHLFGESLPEQVGKMGIFKTYKYGKIALTLYQCINFSREQRGVT